MIKHNTMTLGEVIDNLDLGEVAIRVNGKESINGRKINNGLHYDPEDNLLKSYPDNILINFVFDNVKINESRFITLPKENADKFIFNR